MTLERFRRIRNLYEAALEMDEAGRPAFLAQACQGDDDLGHEVEKLLVANACATALMDGPLLATVDAGVGADPAPRMEGRRVGAYVILREIGHGGMGTVYLASREDGLVHKQVAIKVVRAELGDADVLRRFRQERDILAALDHPAVARLIDGGSTDLGLPYFVMDYVDGEPIDAWCDRRKLNVTGRLKLFQSVCEGVQYAHQHLVVHGDLKPSNILVTADGHVKLLDFGIARLLNSDGTAGSSPGTETRMRMTPEYASPEQVRGETLNTTSDIYALGVVLYELLTGRRPYRVNSRIQYEIARVICEEEPTLPSEAIGQVEAAQEPPTAGARSISEVREGDPCRLRHRLEGDLDNILLKALQKAPAQRYSSADQFSEDVNRHLEGLPVSARKSTVWYRAGKFLRRHQVGVAAGVFSVSALLLGLITTLWQTHMALQAFSRGDARAIPVLVPEFVQFTVILWLALGAAVYFARASPRRVLAALGGGLAFMLLAMAEETLPASMGLRHFNWTIMPQPIGLVYAGVVPYGALIALLGWRITRKFGWRGQVTLLLASLIGGPARDYFYSTWFPGITGVPGFLPWIADGVLWFGGVGSGQAIMRLIAGPAKR
jgi:serine/threonine protein kinase